MQRREQVKCFLPRRMPVPPMAAPRFAPDRPAAFGGQKETAASRNGGNTAVNGPQEATGAQGAPGTTSGYG